MKMSTDLDQIAREAAGECCGKLPGEAEIADIIKQAIAQARAPLVALIEEVRKWHKGKCDGGHPCYWFIMANAVLTGTEEKK
jgi:hypothetical protein